MQPGYSGRIDRLRSLLTGPLIAMLACLGLGLAAPSAMAHDRPAAQTGAASAVDTSSATLGGIVDPNGSDTWFFFAYGAGDYDSRTPLRARATARIRWRSARPSRASARRPPTTCA